LLCGDCLLFLPLQQCQLQQELSSCKEALAEAQQEVARLEADSRQLEALRRSSTPNAPVSCSRIPPAPTMARPSTAAGNYASPQSAAATAEPGKGQQQQQQLFDKWPDGEAGTQPDCKSSGGGGNTSACSSPGKSGIPTFAFSARPPTAATAFPVSSSNSTKQMPPPAAVRLALQLPQTTLASAASGAQSCQTGTPTASSPSSARGSNNAAGLLLTPRGASMSGAGTAGSAKAVGGVLHRDLTALRRLSHSSPGKPQLNTGPVGVQPAAAIAAAPGGTGSPAAVAAGNSAAARRRSSAAGAVPLMQALTSPRLSVTGQMLQACSTLGFDLSPHQEVG
jgi:hypothetical protein